MLDKLKQSDFSPHLDQTFVLGGAGGDIPLRLIEASPLGPASDDPQRAAFSLVFSGPSERPLSQGMFEIRHPQLGTLPLFLVPVGPDPDGCLRYEAIFN